MHVITSLRHGTYQNIAIQHNTHKVIPMDAVTERSQTIDPTAKYYNVFNDVSR